VKNYTKEGVLKANVELHTQLADVYNKDEPHWKPENIQIVRARLQFLKQAVGAANMLDIGCGTGFMIEVARPLGFAAITGMDITPRMIEQVDGTGSAKVELILGDVSQIPRPDGSFDVATAYSFIDHLYDMPAVFKEVNRALKTGGAFYAGLIPNEPYWTAINQLDPSLQYSESIAREIRHVSQKDSEINQTYGVDQETFKIAEYQKNIRGGLSEVALRGQLLEAGFTRVEFIYDWFLGQRKIHLDETLSVKERESRTALIEAALREQLPISRSLFKYLSFYAFK
jgi:ubiquinone/menaquinone biosynthesis C-methylase UbiE